MSFQCVMASSFVRHRLLSVLLLTALAAHAYGSNVQMFVDVGTALSVNGETRVPPVFGLT